jgi:uncharacterized protein (DUF1697 family)
MRYVAFLRAVNVPGHGTLKMTELAKAFSAAGCGDVRTFIQSGNVLFEAPRAGRQAVFQRVADRVRTLTGGEPQIMFRSLDEIARLAHADAFAPYVDERGVKLYVAFLARPPRSIPRGPIRSVKEALDVVGIDGREAFIVSRRKPNSIMFGFPNNFIEEVLGVPATTRNRSTLLKIAALPGVA